MRTTHHKYTIIKSLHARGTGHAHHLMDITCVALLILFSISLSSCRKELFSRAFITFAKQEK